MVGSGAAAAAAGALAAAAVAWAAYPTIKRWLDVRRFGPGQWVWTPAGERWMRRNPPLTAEQAAALTARKTDTKLEDAASFYRREAPDERRVVVVRRADADKAAEAEAEKDRASHQPRRRVVACRGWSDTKPVDAQAGANPDWMRFVPSLNRPALHANRDIFTLRDVLPPGGPGYGDLDLEGLFARTGDSNRRVVVVRRTPPDTAPDPNGGLEPPKQATGARPSVVVVDRLQVLA